MSNEDDEIAALPKRRRRSWTLEEKRRIVEECVGPGASIAEVARRYELNANQLFTWRKQFGVEAAVTRELAPLLPVTVAPEAEADGSSPRYTPGSTGQMEIVLAKGGRVLVWDDVDTAALRRVLEALARR